MFESELDFSNQAQEKLLLLLLSSVMSGNKAMASTERKQSRFSFANAPAGEKKRVKKPIDDPSMQTEIPDSLDQSAAPNPPQEVPSNINETMAAAAGTSAPASALKFRWTFWYDDSTKRGLSEEDYKKSLRNVGSFQTIAEFWECWTALKKNFPFDGKQEANFRVFKEGIHPTWEDPANNSGGQWTILASKQSNLWNDWLSLIITLIIGELGFHDQISGAVFSYRSWGSKFSVWKNRGGDINTVSQKLKQLFQASHVSYSLHRAHKQLKNSRRKALKSSEESAGTSLKQDFWSIHKKQRAERKVNKIDSRDNSPKYLSQSSSSESLAEQASSMAIVERPATAETQRTQVDGPAIESNSSEVSEAEQNEAVEEIGENVDAAAAKKRRNKRKREKKRAAAQTARLAATELELPVVVQERAAAEDLPTASEDLPERTKADVSFFTRLGVSCAVLSVASVAAAFASYCVM
eukprot:TRINITY_DN972_c0_g1_i5.p1 TRINITY_DN972_c0_g1~~TRINITY_DN972_c0_g1_i5.p1  ORF type:complete len:466 (-),score=106.24 TRINITY_DN972_c0_g1_i5:21-1418(-)